MRDGFAQESKPNFTSLRFWRGSVSSQKDLSEEKAVQPWWEGEGRRQQGGGGGGCQHGCLCFCHPELHQEEEK